MGLFSRFIDFICGKDEEVEQTTTVLPDSPCSDIPCSEPPGMGCVEAAASPFPVKKKETTKHYLKVEFEQTAFDLKQQRSVANEKLDRLDDVLEKKLKEKNGGSHGDR